MLISLLAFIFAIAGYLLTARRPGHTRIHLVLSAGVGGGLAGALLGIVLIVDGGSFADAFPYALIALGEGLAIGLVGVLARALGKWLGREP